MLEVVKEGGRFLEEDLTADCWTGNKNQIRNWQENEKEKVRETWYLESENEEGTDRVVKEFINWVSNS